MEICRWGAGEVPTDKRAGPGLTPWGDARDKCAGGAGETPMLRARCLLLAALVLSCTQQSQAPSEPESLSGVQVAGCGDVLEGPVCRMGASRKLRVFVPADTTVVGAATNTGPAPFQATSLGTAGARLEVDVPEGATRLDVTATIAGRPARFTMRLGDVPPEPAWIQEVRAKHRAGDAARAMQLLDEGGADRGVLDGHVEAIVASIRARAALAAGDTARAVPLLARSADLHAARGELSSAADDESVRAYALIEELRAFGDARASLARLERFSRDYPDGAAMATYYEGNLALAAGDVRVGLASLEEAQRRAEAIGDDDVARGAEGAHAYGLLGVGRIDEAYRLLESLDRAHGAEMAPCERAAVLVNLAEAALLAREAHAADGAEPSPGPDAPLALAEQMYRTTCLDAQTLAVVLLDEAWARLQDHRTADARALIASARAAAPQLDVLAALTAIDLDGRASLADGDAAHALTTYHALATRAAGVSRPFEARAAEGESIARGKLGDAKGALGAIERAESALDEIARSVPLGEGRGAFWWSRAGVSTRRVSLLLQTGRGADALQAARTARARLRKDVERTALGATLPAESRRRWEDALAEYAQGRASLSASATSDWSLSATALERAAAARHVRDLALRAKLDGVARDVFPAPPEPRPLATEPGTIALACVPLEGGWAVFRVEAGAVHVERVSAPTDAAHAEQAATTLLASQAPAVRRARLVQWLAFDALREVDVHGLPFDGEPLIVHAPVEYVVDAATPAPSPIVGGALVVADPTGTLPGARREGAAVAALLGSAESTVLFGSDATRARVLDELPRASWLEFSGHAAYAGADGWDSALQLAGGERVGIADVLALPHVPALVILSGCETGKGGEHVGAPGLGLADAFIAAGAQAVIASTRSVRDEESEALLRTLAPAVRAHPDDVAEALREAQLALRHDAPDADWAAYRAFVP